MEKRSGSFGEEAGPDKTQRRGSIGSARASCLRVEKRGSSDQQRRNSFVKAHTPSTENNVPTCHVCHDLIKEGTLVEALDHTYHASCFVCANCLLTLQNYHQHNEKLYCAECLAKLSGDCSVCNLSLGNSFIIACTGSTYHYQCFACSQCRLPLGSKEHYTLCDAGQILCDVCHQHNLAVLISNDRYVSVLWGEVTFYKTAGGETRVSRIVPSSDPYEAGLREDDLLLSVDDLLVTSTAHINHQGLVEIPGLHTGRPVQLKVVTQRSRYPSDSCSSPPSPPPPSTRAHKRRLLKTLSSSPPPPMDSPTKTSAIFNQADITVGRMIGRGFFGQVCEATLLCTGEKLCLKELNNVDGDGAQALIDEIAVLKHLNHRNVLAFRGVVKGSPHLALLTEFVKGGTLRQLIKHKAKVIPWPLRLNMACDIASGMAYLHSKQVIHRDLTSKNCLLREDQTVVVADFGLAQCQPISHYTQPFMNPSVVKGKRRINGVGAVFWRAPEMIHDKPYDEKVDIFSYGIVLCELIARVKADPDYLPRIDSTWGVDEEEFKLLVPEGCPEEFLAVTMQCCCVQSELRPSFSRIVEFLQILSEGGDPSSQLRVMLRALHSIDEDSDSE